VTTFLTRITVASAGRPRSAAEVRPASERAFAGHSCCACLSQPGEDLLVLPQAVGPSPRELRVLRYLTTDPPRAEIAAGLLSVPVNTIGAHP
jgi:hypothetical protein